MLILAMADTGDSVCIASCRQDGRMVDLQETI